MGYLVIKYLTTAALVVIISELAKRSDRLGALVASLPLVTLLTLLWLYVEGQPQSKISNHAWYTFWYVIPTLPMFLVFPYLHARFGFGLTLLLCVAITIACFAAFAMVLKRFGIVLM